MADPKLLPRNLTFFSEKHNHFPTKGLANGSVKPAASSFPKLNNAISNVGCLRQRLAEEGVHFQIPNYRNLGDKAKTYNFRVCSIFSRQVSSCVVSALDEYWIKTEDWRRVINETHLLNYVQPYKQVVSSTISSWMKKL